MAGKWKKRLKKIGKVAAIAGAAALAAKLGKARGMKGNVSKTAAMENIIGSAPRVDDYNYTPKIITPKRKHPRAPFSQTDMWDNPWGAKKGGRTGAKHGGSVTGIAKHGFGRALMKGKK